MENQPGISLKNKPYFNDCVQWNQDGQLAICLESHVHIMTPILVGPTSKEENYTHVGFTLPPFQKTLTNTIVDDPNDVQTSYFNEEGFRCAKWSSFGLSTCQSCVLIVVTTKHRVFLYQGSKKNPTNSDWQLVADITDQIEQTAISHSHPTRINPHHTLYANWSKALVPHPFATRSSLIALSNKAGDLVFWTYSTDTGPQYATTITPHKSFVNLLEWTSWKKLDDDKYVAFVISTCTNGTVALSSVNVEIAVDDQKHTQILDIQARVLFSWFGETSSVPTLLKIFDNLEHDKQDLKIAVSKGISVQFLHMKVGKGDNLSMCGEWTSFYLANSALGLSGGSWIDADQFRCYTMEGEGLLINFGADGQIHKDEDMCNVINTKLVQKYKQQWMEEQMKTEDQDLFGLSDAVPYLWGAGDASNYIFTAVYFGMSPIIDIHYRHHSLEDASLAFILHRDRGVDIDSLCQDIDTYVNDPDFFFLKPVKGIVRDTLHYLVEEDNIEPISMWISKLMKYLEKEPIASEGNLARAIYSEPNVIAARILVNASIELQHYKINGSPVTSACEFAKTAVQLNYISNVLRYALQLPDKEFAEFDEQDIMVLLLLTDSAMIFGQETVVKQSLALYKRLQDQFVDLDLESEIAYAISFDPCDAPQDRKPREKCPVCDELVNIIDGGLVAQCNAGHFWELCSMTKRVLYAPNTRKCVTCGAKSLQPTNQKQSLTDFILTNCWKCIYCGSGLLNP